MCGLERKSVSFPKKSLKVLLNPDLLMLPAIGLRYKRSHNLTEVTQPMCSTVMIINL